MNYTLLDMQTEFLELIKTICLIPSPSHHEENKTNFIFSWLKEMGANNAFIDEVSNVISSFGNENAPTIIYIAHIDTVFPDLSPFTTLHEKDGKLFCPSVGDNSANVAALMLMAKYLHKNNVQFENNRVLLVFNVCEEGLGDLKGVKHIFKNYGQNVKEVIVVDEPINVMCVNAVGSKRYEIEVQTEGGHSYGAFGNANAIHKMAALIMDLYQIKIPVKTGTKSTFNVGTISGGTSVNSIAQDCRILFEYRSDDYECLMNIEKQFFAITNNFHTHCDALNIALVGDRPCAVFSNFDAQQQLIDRISAQVFATTGTKPKQTSVSMDSNLPMSLDIPSVSVGTYIGKNSHTREEYIEIASLNTGIESLLNIILNNS